MNVIGEIDEYQNNEKSESVNYVNNVFQNNAKSDYYENNGYWNNETDVYQNNGMNGSANYVNNVFQNNERNGLLN